MNFLPQFLSGPHKGQPATPHLLIGELLSPNKQVDPGEAGSSAKEGDLHALVRIPETEQQGSGVLPEGKQIIAFAFKIHGTFYELVLS